MLREVPAKMNAFLAEVAATARKAFGGRVTYASGPWEAADWGPFDVVATGWTIVERGAEPPRLNGDYLRDEGEQATYLRELVGVFEQEGLDSAFWFTFAGYGLPHRADPRYDLDMAAYGVVKVLEDGRGSEYPDMGWEPKESFHALAAAYAG